MRGRLTSSTAPAPTSGGTRSATNYQYTTDSLISSITDPLSRVTSFSYDAGGRNTRVTLPDPDGAGPLAASYTDMTYDSLGNLLSQQDALGHKTSFTLDSAFQTLMSTDPAGAVTTMTYDSFGNVLSVVDPLSNTTQYSYNRLNQVVSEDKPLSGVSSLRSYSYDGLGNLRSMVDRNGRSTEWDYDGRNRVTTETWKTGTMVNRTLTNSYDVLDRTTAVADSDALATDFQFVYDTRSQLQNERQLTGLVGTSVVFDRNYDDVGNRTRLDANFGGTLSGSSIAGGMYDFQSNFVYDGMNRLTSVQQTQASGANAVAPKLATFQYNAASQLADLKRYSATSASSGALEVHSRMAYDAAGRLKSLTHAKSEIAANEFWDGTSSVPASLTASDVLAAYAFTFDQANRMSTFASYRDAFQTGYSYDTRDQLTAASSTAIAGLTPPFTIPSAEGYTLDENGNRKSSSGASQSASGTQNRLQTDGTYNYTYDAEGSTLTRTDIATLEVTEYSWDHRNRMTSVTERVSAAGALTKKTEFIYDAFDQRVAKRVDIDGDTDWDRYEAFVWADGQEVLRLEDSDGTGTADGFRIASRYLYGDSVDQVLADEQNASGTGPLVNSTTAATQAGMTLWTLGDHLGSVRDVVDNNAVVRQHVVYDSFGNRILEADYDSSGNAIASSNAAAIDELFGYSGRDWDEDVNLQYNRARWYDPATGRWMNQDPIGFAAGDANLYRYVANGPTNWIDPSGLTWENTPNWHHLVPQELRTIFGDKVDQAWNGWFLRAGDHSALHSAGWNKDWNKWIENFRITSGRNPTLTEAKGFMTDLMSDPKYKCILDRGFKAGWSHAKWLDKSGIVKQKIGALLAEQLASVTGKTVAKKTGKGVLASIPVVSILFSLYDYPARAQEFGTGPAIGMSVLDNIPIVDIALAASEGIDAVQQARLKAESEGLQEQARLINELMREAREAGANYADTECKN